MRLVRKARAKGFHDDKLIVRLRPEARAEGGALTMAVGAPTPAASEGLSALAFYERAGAIRRVTPIRPSGVSFAGQGLNLDERSDEATPLSASARVRASAGEGAVTALTHAARASDTRPGAGFALVELEPGSDAQALKLALARDPQVASVSSAPIRYLLARRARSASPPADTMWNLQRIKWRPARTRAGFRDAHQIKVAVLDSGVDEDHPDLAGCIGKYVYRHPDRPRASARDDVIGHGTHVCGTIAAIANNAIGVNGICAAKLYVWKIFTDKPELAEDENGGAEFTYFVDPVMYIRALLDCADEGIGVVNLSIGGGGEPSEAENEAYAALAEAGVVVVAAMGNEREDGSPTSYPAAIKGVIAVGATTIHDKVSYFSNRGSHIWISAPGSAIWSTLPTYPGQDGFAAQRDAAGEWRAGAASTRETDYEAWYGTSMASPHVAAAAALYLANKNGASVAVVKAALKASAFKVAAMHGRAFHQDYGYGRLDLDSLMAGAIPQSGGP